MCKAGQTRMCRHLATLDFNSVAVVHDPTLVWHHFCDQRFRLSLADNLADKLTGSKKRARNGLNHNKISI